MDALVIALGGNALLQRGEKPSFSVQLKNARKTAKSIAGRLAKEQAFVITHGNGPQVGNELLRNIYARKKLPQMPLRIVNAETQAIIGSILQSTIASELRKIGSEKRICTVLTHVLVDRKDKAFENPTKPIGPFYSKKELQEQLKIEKFDYVREGSSYRRVVASPNPIKIIEIDQVRELVKDGFGVICCGGGGIPIFDDWNGANAVIDKDRTTQRLANSINAKRMAILTNVDCVYNDYGKRQSPMKRMDAASIGKALEEFEEGTMRPKLEACADFIMKGGKSAYIGNLFSLGSILAGDSGTMIA